MSQSDFRRGVRRGVTSTLGIGGLVVVAAMALWSFVTRNDPPDPTATRHRIVGTVTEKASQFCIDDDSDRGNTGVRGLWCGIAHGTAEDVSVGDSVVGSLIGIEVDPGSGYAWSIWDYVEREEP